MFVYSEQGVNNMRTIALRYSENFSPSIGTIRAHEEIIKTNGFVWYGKLGSYISDTVRSSILSNETPQILLIESGGQARYWAKIIDVSRVTPPIKEIPEYYRENRDKFSSWLKVSSFEKADKNVMSRCYVISSKNSLSDASRKSMSPYFIIEYEVESNE